jgi:hypothetical protein
MNRILPVIFILAAIGIGFFYIDPMWTGQIAQEKQQIASYNSALAAASTFTQKEDQLIAQQNSIPPANLTRLESFLPDGVNNVQLILDLNTLAQKSGVTLSDFSVAGNSNAAPSNSVAGASEGVNQGPASSGGTVGSLTISVSALGSYQAFRTFLAATEQSLRLMDVTALTLSSSATGVYTYGITFRIYWLQ